MSAHSPFSIRLFRSISPKSLPLWLFAVLAACTSPQTDQPLTGAPAALETSTPRPVPAHIADEAWSFNSHSGRMITTAHYRICTTRMEPEYLGRLPLFLEAALQHDRTLITGAGPIPAPGESADQRLSTFIFGEPADFEAFTRRMLGPNSGPMLKIHRGGYAWSGTAVLLNARDQPQETSNSIWAIAAHEGWHQFTQRTFKQPLPTWLEEGLATLSEGQHWDAGGVVFTPADNPERRAQLGRNVAAGRLKSVERLILDAPADLLSGDSNSPAASTGPLDYYAQVWALALMLRDRRPEQLARCVQDACNGTMARHVVSLLERDRATALADLRGLAIAEAYFGGVAALDDDYRQSIPALLTAAP